MMKSVAIRAAWVAVVANAVLLTLKAGATGLSDSLTIFSETLNSLSDVASSAVIVLCVRWAWQRPDEDHPFGHRRAEPLAGLVVAILTGILGFEVCRTAIVSLWEGRLPERIGPFPMVALCVTLVVKSWLAVRFRRLGQQIGSPALRATAVDCRNDVLISLQGLAAVALAAYRVPLLDTLAALVVGVYILYSAHRIGMENVDYLMGRAPDAELLGRIRAAAEGVPGVQAVRSIRAHYVGTLVHVEFTAAVDGALPTINSHDVAEATRAAVEALDAVDRAFVHIAPARGAVE
jgi:cation diffusion facilitator family transporter